MSSNTLRPTLFESTSTASSSIDETNTTLDSSDTNSDDYYHCIPNEYSTDALLTNKKVPASSRLAHARKTSDSHSVDSLKRIETTVYSSITDCLNRSDDSLTSRASDATDDNEAALSEVGLAAAQLENGNEKARKKKPVHKLISMKKKIKKTFSDVDATPDDELNMNCKKMASNHTTDEDSQSKKKRKSRKTVPFMAEWQVVYSAVFIHLCFSASLFCQFYENVVSFYAINIKSIYRSYCNCEYLLSTFFTKSSV